MSLTDRASALREFLRLVNAEEDDPDMAEQDATDLEGAYELLQRGADDAQLYLLDIGLGDFWLSTSSAITWTGSDPDRYWDLPGDFLRFASDEDFGPFRSSDGRRSWGLEISPLERFARRGNCWFFKAAAGVPRVYLTNGAQPIEGMVADYYRSLGAIADATTMDFPEKERALVPAYAAVHAMEQSWFPGGPNEERKIQRNLQRHQQQAWARARRTQQPRRIQRSAVAGEHWF